MRSDAGATARWLATLVCGIALTGVTACSNPKSFVVVSMTSVEGTTIPDVTEVIVDVKQGTTLSKTLTYPPPSKASSLTIDQNITDLSVGFTGGRSGTVTLDIRLRNAANCIVGKGSTVAVLKVGGISHAPQVTVIPVGCSNADGGAPDAIEPDASFRGCDPVAPACGAGKTCQVNCDNRMGECITGGTGGRGTPCLKNNNCMAGTQCFDYTSAGCDVKLCLRFCNENGVCVEPGDGGAGDGGGAEVGGAAVGARSVCAGPVQCGNVATAYHTCTFACDPRQTSVAISGCPTGLTCLIVGSMDQVDCACAEPTRTGTDGVDCTSSAQCAPGFVCNQMGSSKKCRAVCRCDASGMSCTFPNDCTGGRTCSALTNDTTFGACL